MHTSDEQVIFFFLLYIIDLRHFFANECSQYRESLWKAIAVHGVLIQRVRYAVDCEFPNHQLSSSWGQGERVSGSCYQGLVMCPVYVSFVLSMNT